MNEKQQQNRDAPASSLDGRGEALRANTRVESFMAEEGTERPAERRDLMEEILDAENVRKAMKRVRSNKGSPGIDGMTVGMLADFLKQGWTVIKASLLQGTYQPSPVKRVEIPKPGSADKRKLGIPTVTVNCT